MGWENVDSPQSGSSKGLIFRAGDAKKMRRIRLLGGPNTGIFANGPVQIQQHWGPPGQGFPPCACNDPTGRQCIFHQAPLDWRLDKANLMNAIIYPEQGSNEEPVIKLLQGPASVYVQIRDQSAMQNIDPLAVDWMIQRTGTTMQDTRYMVTPAVGAPTHGAVVDLTKWPSQEATVALDAMPALIDPYKVEGFIPMTPDQQEAWLDRITENKAKKAGQAPGTAPAQQAAPPPAPAAAVKPVTPPPAPAAAAAPPPPAPTPAAAPPPPPAPAAAPQIDPKDAARALPAPWPEKGTMGDLDQATLEYIIANAASFPATLQAQVAAAKILVAAPAAATAPPPAPAAAPAANTNGATGDADALKTQMGEFLTSIPELSDLGNARTFFEKLTGVKTLNKMTPEQLQLCVNEAAQGSARVKQILAS